MSRTSIFGLWCIIFLLGCIQENETPDSTLAQADVVPVPLKADRSAARTQEFTQGFRVGVRQVGNLNSGIGVSDNRTGAGFLLYSAQSVHKRFAAKPPHSRNSDHFIAVVFRDGDWFYDNNRRDLVFFQPVPTDVLVARLNFRAGEAKMMSKEEGEFGGIRAGFSHSDIEVRANSWQGKYNRSEFQVVGTHFILSRKAEAHATAIHPGQVGFGIAAYDRRKGKGFLLYSRESLLQRFSGNPPALGNAEHFIAVMHIGDKWFYDNNKSDLQPFNPRNTDILVAEIDFDEDKIIPIIGVNQKIHGVDAGYSNGNLQFNANRWAGLNNDGEFSVRGSNFEPYRERAPGEAAALVLGMLD